MKLKSLNIGRLTTKNNVFFAPLAGFSDYAMRSICISYGAGLTFTEMVSCKGLLYENENTESLLKTADNEDIKCVQIFGNDPYIMRKALESPALAKFDIADINFGCPMPKIYNNGEGSALISNIPLAQKIISECAKSGKIITCKFRIGLTENSLITADFSRACEDYGASLITIHGRTRDKIYAGDPNYLEIEKAKKSVGIPVIANGGIFTIDDADKMMDRTGADGIMLARGALETPWLFAELTNSPYKIDKKSLIHRHIALLKREYDDRTVAVTFRKQLCLYLKGEVGASAFRAELFKLNDTNSVLNAVDNFFDGKIC